MAISFAERLRQQKEAALAAPKLSFKDKITTSITAPEPEPVAAELPKVIQLANEANKIVDESSGRPLPDILPILQRRIAQLQDMEAVTLRTEMDDLRKLLLANPDACMYLLPEDTGMLVLALRRITDNKIAIDMGNTRTAKAASKKASSATLSAEELKAALDDL